MESRVRSLAKATSWQLLGLATMSLLGFLFTGSVASGGLLAVVSCGLGFVTYLLHERVWSGIRWGWVQATRSETQSQTDRSAAAR